MFKKNKFKDMDNVIVLIAQEKMRESDNFKKRVKNVTSYLWKHGVSFEMSFRQDIKRSEVYSIVNYTASQPKKIRKAIFVQQIEDKLPGWDLLSINELSDFIYKNPGYLSTILIIDNATQKIYTDFDFPVNFEL